MPKVSIVIPVYNRAFVIQRTLDSIKNQIFTDWECILVDDHSNDNTKDIINKYIELDKRFVYCLNNRSKGAQGARNTGILKAKGDWILLFDSDDFMHVNYLSTLEPNLTEKQTIVACYGQAMEESSGEIQFLMKRIEDGNIFKKILKGDCYVPFDSSIIRKDCLFKIGLLDESCPSHQEWDTHLRLSKKSEYTIVPEILWDYYVGRNDAISADMTKHIKGQLYIISKNILSFRLFAYHSFLMRTRNILKKVCSHKIIHDKFFLLLKLFLIVPELPLYVFITKCKKNLCK